MLSVAGVNHGADVPGTPVRAVEPWIGVNSQANPAHLDRRLRGRYVYVQLARQSNGEFAPVSVSLAPAGSAVNLRGVVTRGFFSGELHVQYGLDAFDMQEGRAQLVEKAAREHHHIQIAVAIASSGRARIRRLLVDGVPAQ